MLSADQVPALAVALAMLIAAGWLLYLRPNAALHRAFALFLGLRAAFTLTVLANEDVLSTAGRISVYWILAIPAAAANFLYVFSRTRRPGSWERNAGRRFGIRIILLALALLPMVAYLRNHDLYLDAAFNSGALVLFDPLIPLSFALVALVAALAAHASPLRHERSALRIFALGFLVEPAFQAGFRVLTLLRNADTLDALALADLSLRLINVVVVAITLGILNLRDGSWTSRPEKQDWRATLLVGTALTSGLLAQWLFMAAPLSLAQGYLLVAEAFWRFALVIGLGYAVLKYQLFDIDVRVRFVLKQSTFAALAGGVFVLVSETLELIINAEDNTIAIGVAVGLALFFRVLQRAAGGLAARFMPGVTRDPQHIAARKADIYEATCEGILIDGTITPKERSILQTLMTKLELSPEVAKSIEGNVLVRNATR